MSCVIAALLIPAKSITCGRNELTEERNVLPCIPSVCLTCHCVFVAPDCEGVPAKLGALAVDARLFVRGEFVTAFHISGTFVGLAQTSTGSNRSWGG